MTGPEPGRPATFGDAPQEGEDPFELNRAMWDERVEVHVGSRFYDVDGFVAGRRTVNDFEVDELGSVDGLDLVHLQCHFGLDTLSWARSGARVTGLDFSGPAVERAREIALRAGLEATFVQANVYDAVEALGGRTFDVVYTGLGAINWLPDIERWAQVCAALLKPGGTFYVAEFHPFTHVFAPDALELRYSYFHRGPYAWDEAGTYADETATFANTRSIEFQHTMGGIVSAVAAAGLRIELLHEHDFTLFARWPCLQRQERGRYVLPEAVPALPLMFSLRARRT